MKLIQFAQSTRTTLRILQAGLQADKYPRPDKTVVEIILGITWRVSEKLSGEKLPR